MEKRNLRLSFLCLVLFPFLLRADVCPSVAGQLLMDSPTSLAMGAKGALASWKAWFSVTDLAEREDGTRDFAMTAAGAPKIAGTFRVGDDGDVYAEWTFTPEGDVALGMLGVAGDLGMAAYGGGVLVADGETLRLPMGGRGAEIRRTGLSRLELADAAGGRRLAFDFREPVDLLVQYWGEQSMSLRLIVPPDDLETRLYRGGATRRLAFALAGAGRILDGSPVEIAPGPDWIPLDAHGEIEEGSALDFSAMRPTGKPAGAFGRVVARGPHFEFEKKPGVPQRFYGVNVCFGANFPEDMEQAGRLARSIARAGYNAVRIHHHDGWCVDKSDPARVRLDEGMMRRMDALVAACAEEGLYITTDLFVSRDMSGLQWRAIGVDRDGVMSMQDVKFTVPVHEGAYSNFLAFAANWLCHTNAFTGVRYADDPAIAWISLVNEGNIDFSSASSRTRRPGWTEAWEKWLAEKKAADPATWGDVPADIPNGLGLSRHGQAFLVFLQDVETSFMARTRAFLRSLGCNALLTDMNDGWVCTAALVKTRAESFDYVDSHFYVDHPQFLEKAWMLPSWSPNANPFREGKMGAAPVSAVRVLDRPYTVSEFNWCGPSPMRGVAGLATGAEAALQDWAGLWRFAWESELSPALNPGTKAAGYWNTASDPLQLASDRAGMCLFLRGDAEPLARTYAVTYPRETSSSPDSQLAASALANWAWAAWCAKIGGTLGNVPPGAIPAGDFDAAFAKSDDEVRRDLGMENGRDGSTKRPQDGRAVGASQPEIGAGAVRIDPVRGTFRVATPLTCGIFAEGGTHRVGPLGVTIYDPQRPNANDDAANAANDVGAPRQMTNDENSVIAAVGRTSLPPQAASSLRGAAAPVIDRGGNSVAATVWASSLDGAPIAESSRILLTHLTDLQNTGARYAGEKRTVLTDWGRLPYLMRAGKAEVELKIGNDHKSSLNTNDTNININGGASAPGEPQDLHFQVFALSPSGARLREVPAAFDAARSESSPHHCGTLRFTADVAADPANATYLYEIVRDSP